MGVGGFKNKSQNALGEVYETILSDRSSILLVSTTISYQNIPLEKVVLNMIRYISGRKDYMFLENYTEERNVNYLSILLSYRVRTTF